MSKHLLTGLILVTASTFAAEPTAESVLAGTEARRGLIVQVGAEDGSLAIGLAQAEPVVVLAVTGDAKREATVRAALVTAGVYGQATVAALVDGSRLPVRDNSAALVIADLDAKPGVSRDELLRVVRPLGKTWFKSGGVWQVATKPRSPKLDDWGQYHHDAAMSDVGTDQVAGPAYSVQWIAGPQEAMASGVRVFGEVCLLGAKSGLIARDAGSGLPLWQRSDVVMASRYALMLDGERVYVYPEGKNRWPAKAMLALDARTGKTLFEYSDGVTLPVPDGAPQPADKAKVAELSERSRDFQARLNPDGSLLQACDRELAVVDAKTGKRRWAKTAGEDAVWMHPVVVDSVVYVIEGKKAQSYSYTHWPSAQVDRVHSFALADGKERWTYTWPADRPAAAAYNMVPGAGRLGFVLRQPASGKGQVRALVLDAATGKETLFGSNDVFRGEIGGGHSSARALAINDRLWLTTIISLPGSMSLTHPDDSALLDKTYGKLVRPVGCTAYRASKDWIFGSLTTYSLASNQVVHTDAMRTVCDVGAFPANGLSYITPNHCFCQPYLPGSMAFNPRRFPGEESFERLERGPASPATAKPGPGWGLYLADNRRSAWSDEGLPAQLSPAWRINLAGLAGPTELGWSNHWYAQGPVTQPSVAEGIVAVGLTLRQQIVALDPATGKEQWRRVVDGRVDSAPTIYRGLVLAGTRNAWLYAFNRDSGELVWRFNAAPRRELIAVDGQLESPWPLFGSVNVDERGLYAVAGRHTDTDGGLWWWRLDPATGKILGKGRLGSDDLKTTTYGGHNPTQQAPTGANTPAMMMDDRFLLAGLHCDRKSGDLAPAFELFNTSRSWEWEFWKLRYQAGYLVPGNQGLLARTDFLGGYKLSQLSYTSARMYAWKGSDFVMVGGAPQLQHRGGGGGSVLRRMRRLPELKELQSPNPKEPTRPILSYRGADAVWEAAEDLPRGDGLTAIAVAGDAVLAGIEVRNRDRYKERQAMPYRLQVYNFADGKLRQELALASSPITGGIAATGGRVYVVTTDGTLACFGEAK